MRRPGRRRTAIAKFPAGQGRQPGVVGGGGSSPGSGAAESVAELVPLYHVGQEKTWLALSEGRALQPLLEAVLVPRESPHAPLLRGVGRALAERLEDVVNFWVCRNVS